MRFSDFPFLRYLPFFIAGIFTGKAWANDPTVILIALIGTWILYAGLLIYSPHQFRKLKNAVLAYSMLFLFGNWISQNGINSSEKINWNGVDGYLAEVINYDEEKPNSFENVLKIKSILKGGIWENKSGQVVIYHQSKIPLLPGNMVWIPSNPETIPSPSNPYEFNYSGYLERRGILYRQFLKKEVVVINNSSPYFSLYFFKHLRNRLSKFLESKIPDRASNQIAQAILLGQKQFLEKDLKQAYSQTGVMHLLAVSGLHVGIIYALLMVVIKPFGLKKVALKTYLWWVIVLIWVYAVLTGMSPSVVRAAIMFSLLTMGQMRERKPSIFNVLAFSAMLMITFNPQVIFEVGFQLSYLAVAGIALLQPKLLRLWQPDHQWQEYLWQLLTVSMAAQLATFPLTISYFHSFPTYFLIGNLLIIPITFLILQIGVPLLFFGWIPLLGDMMGYLVGKLVTIQNFLVVSIQGLPFSNFARLTISLYTLLGVWLALLIWVSWDYYPKRKLVWLSLILCFSWAGFEVYSYFKSPQEELIIYHTTQGMMLDYAYSGKVQSWNEGINPQDISYQIDPYRVQKNWDVIPDSLFFIKEIGGVLRFPSNKFKIDSQEKKLYLNDPLSIAIQKWENDKWVELPSSNQISFEGAAFRVLF
ncbi:ComEC/Rec2 family competence protein [Algoriphagus lutimaris]|uniref:ComEC/Rec2 family competence protein n=1 Tax=Algoriphagus lutimaris TaxID=613197 RepID=UPI00196B43A3|nr:ComEC/Rec2 family competence protein [Algoriphagus lutimaris]MBN3522131.1 ComEC/Rec2 family competence protein [Algoriphagus lutimaris]